MISTVGSDHKRGRHLFAAIGRLPGVEGAPISKPGGFGSCRSKRVVAVHDERARRLRISEYEKRQHKNIGVPEHMPLVGGSAQPAGANGHAIVLRVRRAQQMINGKAQRALRRGIALDPKVGCLPSCQPGITVLRRSRLPRPRSRARHACAPSRAARRCPWRCARRRSDRAGMFCPARVRGFAGRQPVRLRASSGPAGSVTRRATAMATVVPLLVTWATGPVSVASMDTLPL